MIGWFDNSDPLGQVWFGYSIGWFGLEKKEVLNEDLEEVLNEGLEGVLNIGLE